MRFLKDENATREDVESQTEFNYVFDIVLNLDMQLKDGATASQPTLGGKRLGGNNYDRKRAAPRREME